MPAFPVRAHTHSTLPPCWTASKAHDPTLEYREYNEKAFEPWLKKAYSSSTKPFIEAPSSFFHKYSGEYAIAARQNAIGAIRSIIVNQFGLFQKAGAVALFCKAWHEFTVAEREEKVLQVWRVEQERAENAHLVYLRVEAPEATLSWAKDAWNLDALLTAIMFEADEGVDYRHIPNKAWERLNDATSSATPPSRGLRGFSEESRADRSLYFATFVLRLFGEVVRPSLSASNSHRVLTRLSVPSVPFFLLPSFVIPSSLFLPSASLAPLPRFRPQAGIQQKERTIKGINVAPTEEELQQLAASQPSSGPGVVLDDNNKSRVVRCEKCHKPGSSLLSLPSFLL
jgi:hypothetical protein